MARKQRVNLARALAAKPDLILCDEVTSALDTVVGACILELLGELRRKLGVSYLFISHDISTVRALCDDIVVMYSGHKVEAGLAGSCGVTSGKLPPISAPSNNPELCTFLNRCPARIEACATRPPPAVAELQAAAKFFAIATATNCKPYKRILILRPWEPTHERPFCETGRA